MAGPDGTGVRPDDPVSRLVGFGRYLRATGLSVGTGRILSFCRAASALDPFDREDLYWAGRASLVGHEDIEPFDRAFEAYFGSGMATPAAPGGPPGAGSQLQGPTPGGEGPIGEVREAAAAWDLPGEDEEAEGETAVRIVASSAEVLRHKRFDELSEEEWARMAELIGRLSIQAPLRRTRRLHPSPTGRRFDLRRTLRRSLRTEGEPFRRAWRDRGTRLRPLMLILDVSGSMAPYSRPLLQFAFAIMATGRRIEVFCFGTRLTRVTSSLRARDPDRALADVGRLVEDWEGGTRIGDSLKELLDRWSQHAALRGAVVVLCSDGLERGSPEVLTSQMSRLSRLAHRVMWINPLKGSPLYEPLARGMAAALPHVDAFLPGHNLESLQALSRALADRGAR